MTEQVMVALRDATVKTPDGALFRLRAGKTYANPLHPAVVAYPSDWRPLDIDLPAPVPPTGAPSADATAADELREELVAEAREYRSILDGIVTMLAERGLLAGVDTEQAGWLPRLLGELLGSREPDAIVAYTPPDKAESTAVRDWARGQGITVSDRGVLARSLVENYRTRDRG